MLTNPKQTIVIKIVIFANTFIPVPNKIDKSIGYFGATKTSLDNYLNINNNFQEKIFVNQHYILLIKIFINLN